MQKILPGLKVAGFDVSQHGLAHSHENVRSHLFTIAPRIFIPSATTTSIS